MERRGYSPLVLRTSNMKLFILFIRAWQSMDYSFSFSLSSPQFILAPNCHFLAYIFLPTLHLRRIQSMKLLSFREHVYPLSCSYLYTGTVACWLNLALVLCILSQSILFSNSIHLQVSVSGFLASYGLFILPYFFYPSCPQGLQLLCIIRSLVLYSYSLSLSVYLSL